jgi:hypothetical protein
MLGKACLAENGWLPKLLKEGLVGHGKDRMMQQRKATGIICIAAASRLLFKSFLNDYCWNGCSIPFACGTWRKTTKCNGSIPFSDGRRAKNFPIKNHRNRYSKAGSAAT